MSKISVIMSVFNGASLLKKSIPSIQRQTFSDFEFLIVNDGSTDETKSILQYYSNVDRRIRVIENERNLGLAASLNKAWRTATGTFIARMDSDDISEPERLNKQIKFLESHEDVVVLGTNATLINQKEETIGRSLQRESHHELVKHMGTENPFFHSSVMMRKTFLEATDGYDENFQRSQDYDLWSRGLFVGKYHNLQDPLLCYRVTSGLSWSTIYWGAYSKYRHARRAGMRLSSLWYPTRFMIGTVATKYGLRKIRVEKS